MASAVKKEGRETNEGLIGAAEGKEVIALVEVNAETDFVTQNEKFKQFLRDVAQEAADSASSSLDALMKRPYHKGQIHFPRSVSCPRRCKVLEKIFK